MTNQALTTVNAPEMALASPDDAALFGLDQMDRSDQIIPRVRLAQLMSNLPGADPGEFHNNVTGNAMKEFIAVILRVSKGRVMWPDQYAREQEPLCASDNSRAPREKYAGIYDLGKGCAQCPMSAWGEEGQTPFCSLAYTYLGIDFTTGLPFLISLSRTSAKTAKQLNTLFAGYTITHAFKFSVSELITGEKGRWYEARVADAGKVDDPARFMALARQFAGRAISTDTGPEGEGTLSAEDMAAEEDLPF